MVYSGQYRSMLETWQELQLAPVPLWTGAVFIVDEDRAKPLNVPSVAAVKSLQRLGEGTYELVKGKL
ncbi:MAG: hypothetical protein KAQ85_02405 [Thermodesulfovibrionia bacterium]|nr:hypothetical protein [Thermodesulfovibrionia bacterium]